MTLRTAARPAITTIIPETTHDALIVTPAVYDALCNARLLRLVGTEHPPGATYPVYGYPADDGQGGTMRCWLIAGEAAFEADDATDRYYAAVTALLRDCGHDGALTHTELTCVVHSHEHDRDPADCAQIIVHRRDLLAARAVAHAQEG